MGKIVLKCSFGELYCGIYCWKSFFTVLVMSRCKTQFLTISDEISDCISEDIHPKSKYLNIVVP